MKMAVFRVAEVLAASIVRVMRALVVTSETSVNFTGLYGAAFQKSVALVRT
jgi:hypothetical protein